MGSLRVCLAIAGKDLRSEIRTKESLNAALAFAVIMLVLFSFTADITTPEVIYDMSGGLLWMVYAFAGALILNRSFARELPNDSLDALIASPASGSTLFLGKAAANYLLLLVVELICLPLFGVLYNVRWERQIPWLLIVILLGTWAMAAVGTAFSALTVNLRLRELMLPTLIYPILIPALMAGMRLTTMLISGNPIAGDDWIWVRLLIGFDIIFTSLALLLVEYVLVG